LTGWGSTSGGIWNADWSKPVYNVVYPTNIDGHVLSGESKYAYYLKSPEDYLDDSWKNMDGSLNSLNPFLTEKKYNHRIYVEISLNTIIFFLMRREELKVEAAFYHCEWQKVCTAQMSKTKKAKWCPYNGCGMSNGAAQPVKITCKTCQTPHTNFDKLCPNCHTCFSCGRIGKKFYSKEKKQ
jgi:hypothetical protein